MISVFVSVQMQVLAVVFFIHPLSVKLKGTKKNPHYYCSRKFMFLHQWCGLKLLITRLQYAHSQ